MRHRTSWPCLAGLLAASSPTVVAHDGGVFAIITLTVIAAFIAGVVGGTLSGWYDWRVSRCIGGTLAVCIAGIVVLELATDTAIAENFVPNVAFLASFAAIPVALGYFVAHLVGRGGRRAPKVDKEAPNSTAESDARNSSARGSP